LNLTEPSSSDGTPILRSRDAISYVCYFIFVWWIWVSQVAYNMRFRQADILHRIWMFLQLIVFCALAAFTKDFDITNGLVNNNAEQQELEKVLVLSFTASVEDSNALKYRQDRLPLLNSQCLSFVMASSRLLLLIQYIVGEQPYLELVAFIVRYAIP
jgi:hypothetical protein